MNNKNLLNAVVDDVIENVLASTHSRNESKVRQLIFQFWGQAEKKYDCFFCMDMETYEIMIDRIYTKMYKSI